MGGRLFDGLSKDLGVYLKSEYGCDIKIHVGEHSQKSYDAHSVILAARSPYFRKKINDTPLNPGKVMELDEPKISPCVFESLLRYMYTGVVPPHSIETDNFLDVLFATNEPFLSDDPNPVIDFVLTANELELDELVNYLQNILVDNRAEWLYENFDKIYTRIDKYQSFKILRDFYKDIIRTDVELMFQLENFSKIPLSDVISIASRDDLLVDEIEIWNQVVRWSIAQFKNLSRNPKHWTYEQCDDVKSIMHNFVNLIRWSYISGEDFTAKVVPYAKILPDELYQELVRYHVNPNKKPKSFDSPRRVGKIESNLMSIEHASLISQWIKAQHARSIWKWISPTTETTQYRYNLLTRGSQNGFGKSDFQEACRHKGPTITLIRLEGSDLIIGGYNPTLWITSENQNSRAQKSFIFAFDDDRADPTEVGRLGKPKNSNTCPIISITDKGLKFGKDLSLNFTDSHNQMDCVLNYLNVEYTLLDNVQRWIKNPANIKDYEVFSIHNIQASNRLPLSGRIFRRSMIFLRVSLTMILDIVLKLLLDYHAPGKILEILKFFICDFILKYEIPRLTFEVLKIFSKIPTFVLMPGSYNYGKSFVARNDPTIKKWLVALFIGFVGPYVIYYVLWYLGYSLFHPGWLFWTWDWSIIVAVIFMGIRSIYLLVE